ncbi:MAG: TonB-dependent receptor [Xanthomonadales bacterium]|nr:TonB-dependent receptor [Xanthomonadales bacterium]
MKIRFKVLLFMSSLVWGIGLIGVTFFPIAALAQNPAVDLEEDAESGALEEVTVTGSRIKRQELITSTPITVIGAQDYTLSGTTNVEQLLNSMPQVIPGEGGYTNNDSNGVATVDLRGLGVQRGLVLVNGRRYIFFDSTQVTDLNTVPAALVAGTEIVTGGSSAVYGSDAISGVVNFLLKDDFEGLALTGQYDVSRHGDGDTMNFDVTMGGNFADDRGNAVVYFNYLDREAVLADARKQSEFFLVDAVDANGKPILSPGGSSSIPNGRISGFPVSGPEFLARPGLQAALAAAGLTGVGSFGFKFDDTGKIVSPFVSPGDQYNFNPLNYLQLPQERKMVGTLATYQISDKAEAYVEGMFVQNIVETKRAPTPVGGSALFQVNSPFLTPAVQAIFRALDASEGTVQRGANGAPVLGPDGLPIITPAATRNDGYTTVGYARRLAEVATRDVVFERNALRALFGLRGDLDDMGFLKNPDYDMYYSYARTRNVTNSFGSTLAAAFTQGLTTKFDANGNLVCVNPANGCRPINMFGPFISPEAAGFFQTSQTSSEEASMQVASAVITGDTFALPAGNIGLAFGAEYRTVDGLFVPSQGGVGDVNTGPTGGDYDVWELFTEVLVPIAESFEATAALRYSDYSLENVGGVWTYGTGLTWNINNSFMLRGQYQHAVRAPSVDELFSAQTGSAPAAVDPCARPNAATDPVIRDLCVATGVPIGLVGDPGLQPNFQITGITGGNPNLQEESGDTYTFGLVFTPEYFKGLSVTLDYYNITVEDAIAQSGGSVNNVLDLCYNRIQSVNSVFCRSVVRQPNGIINTPGGVFVLNENIGQIETDGIDLHASYAWDVGFGLFSEGSSFDVTFGATWLNNFDVTPVAELPGLVNECADSFGLTCGEPLPEFKSTTRLNWYTGPLTLSLRWRWLASVTDDRITNGPRLPAQLAVPYTGDVNYFDLTGYYTINDNYSFTLGIENIFDEIQPIIGSSQEQLNTFPSTYDPFGRLYFFSFTAHY